MLRTRRSDASDGDTETPLNRTHRTSAGPAAAPIVHQRAARRLASRQYALVPQHGLIIDIGGVLATSGLIEAVDTSRPRLGLDHSGLLAAVYGGNDDTVLVGRVSEDDWWDTVKGRIGGDVSQLRRGPESDQHWDLELVEVVRSAKSSARTAILSNAWPSQHQAMRDAGVDDVVHHVLLSCGIGVAKPDVAAFHRGPRTARDRTV